MNNYNRNVGYKINLKGKASSQEIIERIAAELLNLQENFGIEEFSGINFYCQMYKDGENQTLISKKTNSMLGGTSYKSKNTHKTIENIDKGKKIVSYKKSIEFDNLKNVVSNLIDQSFVNSDNFYLLSMSEINTEYKRLEDERLALRKKLKEQEAIQRSLRIEQQRKEEELLFKFKDKIKSDFHIENDDDFKLKVSSFAYVVAPHTIKKYLGEQESYNEKYFRVTLKNKETQKAGDVYIYDLNLYRLKHIKK